MADLGNLKILLDMATTGNLKSTLESVDKRLDKMREKASSLQLGFDEKSVSALSTKMRDIATSMQEVSRNAGTSLVQGMQKSAEATKATTSEMQQQVALSADLEALFKEMAGTLRTIAENQGKVTASKKASSAATKEEAKDEKTLYDITRLRQIAEEKNGQLTADQISVLKQMEAIEKALLDIDQKHSTNLADQLKKWMHYDGVTKEQLGTYQALITRMQAAMKVEQKAARETEKASRTQKAAAKEREAAAKRQAQLETTIIRIETQLLGINEARLATETQLLVTKMRSGQITQEEASRLSALLTQHRAIENAERRKVESVEKTNMHLGRQSGLLQQINSYLATYVSVIGAVNLIRNLVRITGEFEAQHVALRAILQDVAGADRIFYQLQELAVKSPFTFRNLTDYAKQLSAFSVPMNEIYDTTKRLADVSAGLGVDMSRIILAYGQIRSASFLRGQEVRQLTEAGIPVLQELSKQFKEIEGEAVSVGKVFDKISARQVPFEMIERMFKDLTSEGGKFYEMQETLAETVKGKVSNLQDAWEIMLSKVGEDNDKFIKGVLDGVTNLIKNYKELAKAIELAAIAYGTYRVAAMAATQAEAMQRLVHIATGKNIAKIPALLTRVTVGLRSIPKAIAGIVTKLNPWAIGIAAVTTAVAALIIRYREMNRHLRETDKVTGEAIAKAESSKSNIQYYINQMKAAKEGTEEYNKARQAVINSSGSYISATDAERLSLQNVDDVWVNICKHIEEATKLQAMQSVTANAEASRNEKQLKIIDDVISFQKDNNLSAGEYNFVMDYIKGNKSYEELYYSSAARKSRLLQNAVDWRKDWEKAQRIYEDTIAHGKKRLSSLYGTGEPAPAGEPEPLTGWRLRAQQYLDTFNGKTRGVKISEETNLADLAESGAKALNELRKSLDLIPSTESDYKAVEKDIKFWEQLSEAIYGKGKTEFGNTTKLTKQNIKDAEELRKEQIAAIKQSVQDLKEAKRWYDQLAPLLGSKNAETLLASFNFAVPKDGFNAAFQDYANQLKERGDENGARDVMNWANGREVGDVLKSAKAVEKYTDALRKLEAQTKRLNFSGLALEIDKIIVDTDSKNRQLETDWAQQAEELLQGKAGWIQRYEVLYPDDDAEAAWDAYYKSLKDKAEDFMRTQREYNRQVAQEQINGKASKWLEEMMKENNIDFHDMNDKSLEQVNILIERLEGLVSSESLASLIPDELKDDAALINVEFSELLSTIKKIANTKLGDLSVEKMKKTMKKVNGLASVMGLSVNTDAVSESFATLTQRLTEVANAEEDVKKAMDDLDKAQDPESGLDLAKAINKLSEAQEKLAKATEESEEAQREFKISVSMIAVSTFASALTQAAKFMKDLANATNDVDLSKLADIFGEVSQSINAFASGYEKGSWIGAVLNWYVDLLTQIFTKEIEIAAKAKQIRESIRAAFRDNSIKNFKESLDAIGESLFGDSALSKMAEASRRLSDIVSQIKNIKGTDGGELIRNTGRWIPETGEVIRDITYRAVFTKQRNTRWGADDDLIGIEGAAYELGEDLLDKYGNLNVELLRAIRDAGWDLTEEQKEWLDENIAILENYQTAMQQIADGLKSIFGQVGESISESLISSFEASGEAALDTEDIFKSVARSFVKEWTQAFLMKNYLNSLSDAVTGIWQDTGLSADEQIAQSLDLVRDAFAAIGDKLPAIQKFYEGMEDQFHWADGAGEELGDAIKTAMVEQNSSLIAGYINSMRADLSMQRNEIMRNISPAVTNISNTLNDHLASVKSIEGNVANIWNKLNLLTSSGSGVKLNARI